MASGGLRSKGFTGECFYCKKQGHRHRECRASIADEARGKMGPGGVGTVAKASAPKETIWMKASLNPALGLAHSEPVWFVDSGCSNHVTGNRDFIVSYNRFQPGDRHTWIWFAINDLVD